MVKSNMFILKKISLPAAKCSTQVFILKCVCRQLQSKKAVKIQRGV